MDLFLLAAAGLGAAPGLVFGASTVVAGLHHRVKRWRRGRAEGVGLTSLTGHLRAIRPVRSPLEKVECCFSVTMLRGKDRFGLGRTIEVVTGEDFLLEAPGVHLVRIAGASLYRELSFAPTELVQQDLPPTLKAALAASPIAGSTTLYWSELVFLDGDAVEVVGRRREELAPPDLAWRGLRDLPVLPTLSAAGGVLELTAVVQR